MIEVEGLTKDYHVYHKQAGLAGSLKALVRREYSAVRAVDNLSFSIGAGEIVGFIGANGAGKTTALKMLAGLLHPTAGSVRVAGFVPKERAQRFLMSISLVMGQRMQLDWDLSPADFYLVLKTIFDIPDEIFRLRLGKLKEMLGVGAFVNRQTRRLSLGERMKCELIASLLHEPKILFLDEPTIGLDVNVQQAIRRFVADYNQESGATIILTSHYMADVTSLAKRLLIIDRGRLVFDGDLRGFVSQRANYKILRLVAERPMTTEELATFGVVRKLTEFEAELQVDRDSVVAMATQILQRIPILDIGIEEVPIEEIVGRLFDAAGAEGAKP